MALDFYIFQKIQKFIGNKNMTTNIYRTHANDSIIYVPGVSKKTLYVFKSLFFDVMWSKYYKILGGCSGIIF